MRRTILYSLLGMASAAILVSSASSPATAAALCKNGFVWRDATNGDAVCVTPADRAEAKAQNANAANNINPHGPNGPKGCRTGYVWREAFGGDVVCVTPFERQKAHDQKYSSRIAYRASPIRPGLVDAICSSDAVRAACAEGRRDAETPFEERRGSG